VQANAPGKFLKPDETEFPLTGGRVTQGVVRVGDTVRRPPTVNSSFVHVVLSYLQMSGFTGAPRSLGSDETGRDIFSYSAGDVPENLGWYNDDILIEAASLIRRYHDATSTMLMVQPALTAALEVICHNDLSPCNFVFQDGKPITIIDFDAASPGTRLHDLGYAAWMWLDLGNSDIAAERQKQRLEVFTQAYDAGIRPMCLVQAIIRRQIILLAQAKRIGDAQMAQWVASCLQWTRHNLEMQVRQNDAQSD
jgi:hypothetical protein